MKLLFVSLGCDKNRVDSEVMLGLLSQEGHTFTDDVEEAQAAIVNTCCFIGDAKKESVDTLLELAERRTDGRLSALIVTGCLAQRYRGEILEEIPEVDAVVGLAEQSGIAGALAQAIARPEDMERLKVGEPDTAPLSGRRIQTTGGHYNYLRIAEGCDKCCTYCVLPAVRGHYRSVPMEELVVEATQLADEGVRELILVAQETTLYGIDIYGHKALPELLRRLCGIDGLSWIRLLYCYPEEIDDELLSVMASEPKLCHYLDIPVQSGADAVLKRMGRRTTSAEIRDKIRHIRERIPDICIRTTLITGFPGETAEDHRQTMELVSDLRFDRLGVFTYSQEEGTPAAEMPGQISESIKRRRRDAIMRRQQRISRETGAGFVGRSLTAFIEGRLTDGDEPVYVARTYRDAPDVDGQLFIEDVPYELYSGQLVRVRITGADEYDMTGVMEEEEDESA